MSDVYGIICKYQSFKKKKEKWKIENEKSIEIPESSNRTNLEVEIKMLSHIWLAHIRYSTFGKVIKIFRRKLREKKRTKEIQN